MRKIIYTLVILTTIFACSKQELPEPISSVESTSNVEFKKGSNCDKKIAKVQQDITDGSTKRWLTFYYDTNGELVQHPLIDNINGTVYEYTKINDTLGAVNEYNIINDSLVRFNFGTYRIVNCGNTILPNTQIFTEETEVIVTKSNPVKFETSIDAPLGENGSIITIIGKATQYNE